jgi:uncharacterized protein (UPF0332 family)
LSTSFALKAKENLSVGLDLLDSDKLNAAANRLYYALFQAAVHALESKHGMRPDKLQAGAKWWKHDMVRDNMRLLRDNAQDKVVYKALKDLREEADYKPTTVLKPLLTGRRQSVVDLVNEFTK